DGHRRVVEICESAGMRDGEIALNPLFVYDPQKGLVPTGNELRAKGKLVLHGMTDAQGEGETR
ncbi:MAG: CpaF family protein, partial [Firmicutes bacterium]|nr:CpaF family protein [Bacillota bacterium]